MFDPMMMRDMILNRNNKHKDSDMRKFLEEKADYEKRNEESFIGYYCGYDETTNDNATDDVRDYDREDSLTDFEEMENQSYVYRIGVFSMFDANKSDFGEFHIGFQSDKDGEMIYMGCLNFPDGENMSIKTTIKRMAVSMLRCWN